MTIPNKSSQSADYGKENVSTETPKQPYGYLPPKLGGEGMGEQREGDLFLHESSNGWQPVKSPFVEGGFSGTYYTRPIDPGEGYRIVDKTTFDSWVSSGVGAPINWEATKDGINWKLNFTDIETILAIRTRVETPKEPEWPKYYKHISSGCLYRQTSPTRLGKWSDGRWFEDVCRAPEIEWPTELYIPITPTQAEAIMRGETLNKQLAKELADTPYNASPAYEVTKEAQHPFGCSCVQCLKQSMLEGEVIDEDSELTALEQQILSRSIKRKPNWRPIAECDLKEGEQFWELSQFGQVLAWTIMPNTDGIINPNIKQFLTNRKAKGWMRCEGIYQIPPPPEPERCFCKICGLDQEDHKIFKAKLNHTFTT